MEKVKVKEVEMEKVQMKEVENLDIIMCKWRCAGGDEEVEMDVDKMM